MREISADVDELDVDELNNIIMGFDEGGYNVIFRIDDEFIFIKHTLPKNLLIVKLNIRPMDINKNLRDQILEIARQKGMKEIVYSLDEINYQQKRYFKVKNAYTDSKYKKLVSIEEHKKYPYEITNTTNF